MHPNFYLTPLAACLAFTVASSAKAAETLPLQKVPFSTLRHQFQVKLPGLKQAVTSTPNTLLFIQQHTDKNHITHIRMQQEYAGFPVVGGYAIIHTDQPVSELLARNTSTMNGTVYTGLQNELGQPATNFLNNGQQALETFKATYAGQIVSDENVTPIVYLDEQHKAHWAYKVSLLVTHEEKIPERPTAIIDATTFESFIQWNDIKTIQNQLPGIRVPIKGTGFGGNKKVGQIFYGKSMPLLDMTRDPLLGKCYMENTDVKVVDMKHDFQSASNKPMKTACKADKKLPKDTYWTGYKANGYDQYNGAFSPTNDAMYFGYVIKHMYYDWYKVQVLTQPDGKPMQLVMRVHYGDGYENAYWDGSQMTFGDGQSMMYPLVSLGVGAHEVSHGFTEQHSSLEYYGQSGGLNESFSDMAAQAAEFYSTSKNSWTIGAEIMKEGSGLDALRYMDVPSKDGSSIDTADEYYGGLDVHFSSGVFNRMYYLISTHQGWDPRKAFDVMVKANMDYWTPSTTFNEAGCGVLSAAKDLGYETDSIKKAMDQVAVNYQNCGNHS